MPFAVADKVKVVIRSLEKVGESLIIWFSNNQMKLNPEKCCILLNNKEQTILNINTLHIKDSLCKKLLGINFDYKLNFAKHIEYTWQEESRKLNTLVSLAPFLIPSKIWILMNTFFKLQFNYYP